jgi:MazG family protein
LEELHEIMEAVEEEDPRRLREEMGDLLFLLLFLVEVAEERGLFTFPDVVRAASDKIISRHPHVFREPREISSERVRSQWERIKRGEKAQKSRAALQAGAKGMPALLYALRIQQKAASFGFDWDRPEPVLSKIEEELEELKAALAKDPAGRRTGEELGDLLFSAVNAARHANQDPERALRGTVERFCRRFNRMAALMEKEGRSVDEANLETMDSYWERTKSEPSETPTHERPETS